VGCKITKNEIINTAKAGGWGNSIAYSSGILKEGYVSLRFGQTDKQNFGILS
jgi:hypothetical protein